MENAAERGREDATDADLVTVVVPARNEEQFIRSCLDSILAQDYRNIEVLVADGMSTDGTADAVREYANRDARVHLLANPGRIVPTGLNVAVAAARGHWLVRVDAHAAVPPDYVGRAVEHLKTGRWGGVGGRKNGRGETPTGRGIAAAMGARAGTSAYHHGTKPRRVDHIPFGAYPTALIRELGGWDERLVTNQDYEFDYRVRRAGHELLFDPALRIDWASRQTIPALFRQYERYGRGKFTVASLQPGSVRPRHLAGPGLVAALAASLLSAPLTPRVSAALAAPYGLVLAALTVSAGRDLSEWRARAAVPAAFAAMHLGWGIGFWRGAIAAALSRARSRAHSSATEQRG